MLTSMLGMYYVNGPTLWHLLPEPDFLYERLENLQIGTYAPNIYTIKQEARLIDVFQIFLERHISCLPVVDVDGGLVDIYAKFDVIVPQSPL
ncbi:unnamed protein product [Protopolystoma xenopodis]|uniref:CBS domain-containing protein n=1 Tax=Protopolystoma xenopodis TaxID=117903 RepID=A0A3S5AW12_9PLAT|nr:unnamed protein product [Protopolystoma xenopodis]